MHAGVSCTRECERVVAERESARVCVFSVPHSPLRFSHARMSSLRSRLSARSGPSASSSSCWHPLRDMLVRHVSCRLSAASPTPEMRRQFQRDREARWRREESWERPAEEVDRGGGQVGETCFAMPACCEKPFGDGE